AMPRVFISYCHRQGDWVHGELIPVLRAAKAEVLVDRDRFRAGRALMGQMDDLQDAADMNVLILSPEYLKSRYCKHEMRRAIARDPDWKSGRTIPVKVADCDTPPKLASLSPLIVDLRRSSDIQQWNLLLSTIGIFLGIDAPAWLRIR